MPHMPIDLDDQHWFVLGAATLSILFGVYNIKKIFEIRIDSLDTKYREMQDLRANDQAVEHQRRKTEQKMVQVIKLIQDGASTFLKQEYMYTGLFVALFAVVIAICVEPQIGSFYTVGPFLLGAATSICSGAIAMMVAVRTNVRTAFQAQEGLDQAFKVAFRGGIVLGFVLVGLALLILHLLVLYYEAKRETFFPNEDTQVSFFAMFEAIAGYGLGGSTVALFGRVGGGIYTKAADVGSDLVGKVVENLPEDDERNPGVIADNVGDNVGDIAGMGSDLFGSFAEASCACLVVSATSPEMVQDSAFYYPLVISAFGIIVGIITSFVSTHLLTIREAHHVELSLKLQLFVSTALMIPCLYVASIWSLPDEGITFQHIDGGSIVSATEAFVCCASGLVSGLVIGLVTETYTSSSYSPVQGVANASNTGAAPNLIKGLALGYRSTMVPVFCIAFSIMVSFTLANMFGISLAALGMLSTLTTALTIDGFGPVSDNAGGILEMSEAPEVTSERADVLDAAGNTTAAIGKGFAIGSACLVGLALFGAFVESSSLDAVNILRPIEFSGLIVGAMLPYYFSAMTMEAVGDAAQEMIEEI